MQYLHPIPRFINSKARTMTMLEYAKMILQKVSFDQGLFRTELYKAIRKLMQEEVSELKKWCLETFGVSYCMEAAPQLLIEG